MARVLDGVEQMASMLIVIVAGCHEDVTREPLRLFETTNGTGYVADRSFGGLTSVGLPLVSRCAVTVRRKCYQQPTYFLFSQFWDIRGKQGFRSPKYDDVAWNISYPNRCRRDHFTHIRGQNSRRQSGKIRSMLGYSSQKSLERVKGFRTEVRPGRIYQGNRSSMKAKSEFIRVDYLEGNHAPNLDYKSM